MKAILAIVGLVIVVGGGYYFWQNTAAPEAPEPVVEVEDNEYHSAQYGLSFSYPDTYNMTEHDSGTGERMTHSIVLIDKDFQPIPDSEGPPAIAVSIFENTEDLSAEEWITGTSFSNYKLSTDETLTPVTVGGKAGLLYTHSGLYETDAVVVVHNGRVYMFTAGWLTANDQIRSDFEDVMGTVEFVAS